MDEDEVHVDIEEWNGTVVDFAAVNEKNGLIFQDYYKPEYTVPNNEILFQGARPFEEQIDEVMNILDGKVVIAWNMEQLQRCLPDLTKRAKRTVCAMKKFAPYAAEYYHEIHNTWKFISLPNAMKAIGVEFIAPGPHSAVSDAFALLAVWQHMSIHPLGRHQSLIPVSDLKFELSKGKDFPDLDF